MLLTGGDGAGVSASVFVVALPRAALFLENLDEGGGRGSEALERPLAVGRAAVRLPNSGACRFLLTKDSESSTWSARISDSSSCVRNRPPASTNTGAPFAST